MKDRMFRLQWKKMTAGHTTARARTGAKRESDTQNQTGNSNIQGRRVIVSSGVAGNGYGGHRTEKIEIPGSAIQMRDEMRYDFCGDAEIRPDHRLTAQHIHLAAVSGQFLTAIHLRLGERLVRQKARHLRSKSAKQSDSQDQGSKGSRHMPSIHCCRPGTIPTPDNRQ